MASIFSLDNEAPAADICNIVPEIVVQTCSRNNTRTISGGTSEGPNYSNECKEFQQKEKNKAKDSESEYFNSSQLVFPECITYSSDEDGRGRQLGTNRDDSSGKVEEPLFLSPGALLARNGGSKRPSARMRSLKIVREYMTERDSILQMTPDSELFGLPKLQLDSKKMQRNILNQKKPSLFTHLARFHNKFGLRHFVMIGLLALYSLFGGLMFQAIENENELESLRKNKMVLDRMIVRMTEEIVATLKINDTVTTEDKEDVELLIKEYYQTMLKIEGKYIGSVFHKYEHMVDYYSWYFGSSVFYAMTLFTTIGYGTIACQTTMGKIASIFYAMFGIPLMLVVLSDMGQLMLRFFTFSYQRARQYCKNSLRYLAFRILGIEGDVDTMNGIEKNWIKKSRHRVHPSPSLESSHSTNSSDGSSSDEDSDDSSGEQQKQFPLFLSIPIVLVYLLFVSFVVSFFVTSCSIFDWDESGIPGLSFGDAFYFSFLSLSTIGLGDVMPNNIEYSPFLAVLFLIGLALLSVVNSTVYMRIEGHFLALVDHLEEYLERVHYYRHGREGYFVFKTLSPNIQLLALALPIFPNKESDDEEIRDERPVETAATNHHQTVRRFTMRHSQHSRRATRANSTEDQSPSPNSHHQHYHTVHGGEVFFRPTLGIINAAPPSRKGTISTGHEMRALTRRQTNVGRGEGGSRRETARSPRRRAITISHVEGQMVARAIEDEKLRRSKSLRRKRTTTSVTPILARRGKDERSLNEEQRNKREEGERRIYLKKGYQVQIVSANEENIVAIPPETKRNEQTPTVGLRRVQSESRSRQHNTALSVINEVETTKSEQSTVPKVEPDRRRASPRRIRIVERNVQRTISENVFDKGK